MSATNRECKIVQGFSLDPEVLEALRRAAGEVPMSKYLNRLLRRELIEKAEPTAPTVS
jgi:hypothetical protein